MKLTPNQLRYVKKLQDYKTSIHLVTGPAGSGKTALACRHAARLLEKKKIERFIITKPAVSVDEEHGFLPGDIKHKMTPWLLPMLDALGENMEKTKVDALLNKNVIEIAPMAYMRGRTFKNSFILADEMQNCTPNQMKMVMTRLGEGSKMVLTGDIQQNDRPDEQSGMIDFINRLDIDRDYEYIDHIVLEDCDIKRHKAIVEVLEIYEKF